MASAPEAHGAIQMVVAIPNNVVPGQQVAYNTPDGQQVIVVVPEDAAPGSSVTVQYSANQERAMPTVQATQQVHQHVTVPTVLPTQPVQQYVSDPAMLPARPVHQQLVGPAVLSAEPVEPVEAESRPTRCLTCCKCIRGAALITAICLIIMSIPVILLKSHHLHLHHWHPHAWHRHHAHGNHSNHSKHHRHPHRHHAHGNHSNHSNEADMTYVYYDEAETAYGYYSSEHQDNFRPTALRGEIDVTQAHHSSERQDGSRSIAHRHERDISHAEASKANAIKARTVMRSEIDIKDKTRSQSPLKQQLEDYRSNVLKVAKGKMKQQDIQQFHGAGQGRKQLSNFKEQRPESAQSKVSNAMISKTRARSHMPTVMI